MKHFTKLKLSCLVMTSLFSCSAFADVSSDLNSYFNGLGFASNASNPTVIQGQEANYYSGGSLFLRNPVKNMQLVQFQAPSLTAGCGGIDMFGGAFSYINSDQLVTFGKNMLDSAPGVAFNLAMQVYAPTVSHDFEAFQNFMNQMNNFNLNSCTADYAIAGAATEALGNNQYACKDLGAQGGNFADWAAGAVGCKDDSGSAYSYAENQAGGKQQLTVNTNVVWNALQQQSMYSGDQSLSEFMMSLSGTIVFDQNGNPTTYPALANDPTIFNALLNGGQTANIYKCEDSSTCLQITTQTLALPVGQGLIDQVSNYIDGTNGIAQAIASDTALTAAQQSFLSSIPFPLLTYMRTSQESGMNINFDQFSDAIAYMVLINYLLQTEHVVENSVANLTNYNQSTVNQIVTSINSNVNMLNQKLAQTEQSLNNQLQMISTFADAQKRVIGNFSNNMQSNMNFTGE